MRLAEKSESAGDAGAGQTEAKREPKGTSKAEECEARDNQILRIEISKLMEKSNLPLEQHNPANPSSQDSSKSNKIANFFFKTREAIPMKTQQVPKVLKAYFERSSSSKKLSEDVLQKKANFQWLVHNQAMKHLLVYFNFGPKNEVIEVKLGYLEDGSRLKLSIFDMKLRINASHIKSPQFSVYGECRAPFG